MKQLQENPWESLASEFAVDTVTEGRITRILDRGAVVELRFDVEGFVPVGQLGKPDLRHPDDAFAVDDVLPLKVIKVDPKNKRIVLSVGAYLKGVSDEELNEFHARYQIRERPVEEAEEASDAETAPTSEAPAESEPAGPSVGDAEEAEPLEGEAPASALPRDAEGDAPADTEDVGSEADFSDEPREGADPDEDKP
jgi:transcriptional accessory protein Tex/SPT6